MTQTLPSSSSPVPPSGESAPIPVDARTEDPMPDFRQQLASDRTLLAWLRTAISPAGCRMCNRNPQPCGLPRRWDLA